MKKVLIIIPYNLIYPPLNGGMQRCINIFHQLARYFDVTAIINQDRETFLPALKHYPYLVNTKIYSTVSAKGNAFSILPERIVNALTYRWQKRSPISTTDSNFLLYYPVLTKLLKQEKFDFVVLENLDSLNAVSVVKRFDKNVRIIYDAHNVDTILEEAALKKGNTSEAMVNRIRNAEQQISKKADALIACSLNDLDMVRKMNKGALKGSVVPNGVRYRKNLSDAAVRATEINNILFCGTLGSVANLEGLRWFYDRVWPIVSTAFPELKLLVVGSGDPPTVLQHLKSDSRVIFSGSVPDVEPWYNQAAVSVVPLLTGSGTRLKILEAMALGLPVVSTSIGAEGINYTNGKDIIIADTKDLFAKELIDLLQDLEKRLVLQQHAVQLVKHTYSWDIIGDQMAGFINKMPL